MTAEALRLAVAALALAGMWAASAMFATGRRAARGTLPEPSVVDRPEARLFFGIPNALFGLGYYALVAIAAAAGTRFLLGAAAGVSILALGTSAYLAGALLRGHLACSRCWTAHAVNALLCPLLIAAAR